MRTMYETCSINNLLYIHASRCSNVECTPWELNTLHEDMDGASVRYIFTLLDQVSMYVDAYVVIV